jgi:hypothetical protein
MTIRSISPLAHEEVPAAMPRESVKLSTVPNIVFHIYRKQKQNNYKTKQYKI